MGVLRPWAAGVAWPLTLRPAAQEGTPLGLRRLQADLASIPWTLCGAGESSPWSAVSWGHPAHIRLPFAITDGEAVVRTRAWAQGPWRSAVSGRLKKARSRWVRHRRAAAAPVALRPRSETARGCRPDRRSSPHHSDGSHRADSLGPAVGKCKQWREVPSI
jgi:hypothetical protein